MTFIPITSAEIAAGKPTKQEIFTKTKDNFDDHETRLTSVEGTVASVPSIRFNIIGQGFVRDGIMYYRVDKALTGLGFRVLNWEAGSSGTLEVDVQKKRGAGAFASILSANVTLTAASGDFAISSGTLTDTDYAVGDILRLDIVSIQTEPTGHTISIEVS